MDKQIVVGSIVRTVYGFGSGVVKRICEGGRITVRFGFGDSGFSDVYSPEDLELVDSEADKIRFEVIQAKISDTKNAFAKAFESFKSLNDLTEGNLVSLADAELIDLKPLEKLFERNGWRSSSLYC